MLESLAHNLSFALESMDREVKRRQAEEEIIRLNVELKQRVIDLGKQADLIDLAHNAIIVRDLDARRGLLEPWGGEPMDSPKSRLKAK